MKIKILKIESLAIRSDKIISVEMYPDSGIHDVHIVTDAHDYMVQFDCQSNTRTAYNRFVSEWHETLSGE